MKKLLIITYALIGCLRSYSAETSNSTLNLKNGDLLRLEYNLNPQLEEPIQILYLKENGKEVVVSSELARHQIDVNGAHGTTPYEECTVIAADYQAANLSVLYAFGKGRQQVISADSASRGYAKPVIVEKDFLMVLYHKDQGVWETVMSVYIQKLWGDIIGEKISGIRSTGGQSYEIKFDRKWAIEGAASENVDNRRKVPLPNGGEIKTLSFDDKSKLIYATDISGEKFFTLGTTWWMGVNKDHIEDVRLRWDARMRMESAARAKGIKLPDENNALVEDLGKRNITTRDLKFFPESNGSQNTVEITSDMRKKQTEQNKAQHPTDGAPVPEKPKE